MLPELQHELRILLATARANLAQLPEQSRNHVAKASKIIGDFLGAAGKHLEGAPGRDGLHQSIRGPLSVFTAAIRTSAPDFRPYPPPPPNTTTLSFPSFLAPLSVGDSRRLPQVFIQWHCPTLSQCRGENRPSDLFGRGKGTREHVSHS